MKYGNARNPALALMLAGLALGGCSLGVFKEKPEDIPVLQRSDQCNTQSNAAALHYFANPSDFQRWIDRRQVREFRSGAASLRGVFVIELGQRPTSGYSLDLVQAQSGVQDDELHLTITWDSPAQDDAVSQVLTSHCIVVPPPEGNYSTVILFDDSGAEQQRLNFTGS